MSEILGFPLDVARILAIEPGEQFTTSRSRFKEAQKHTSIIEFLSRRDVGWHHDSDDGVVTISRQQAI